MFADWFGGAVGLVDDDGRRASLLVLIVAAAR